MTWATADLSDQHSDTLLIADPGFRDYGGELLFAGRIATVRCFEDNSKVREALEEPGENGVLVVDGGGSMHCALLGDMLAELAVNNHWRGVIVHGCIRDSAAIARTKIGVKALNTHPKKSVKRGEGARDVVVEFAGVAFTPGHWLYADGDGIVISPTPLT